MYSSIVSALFPAYILGCLLAISLSWSKRSLLLSFSYSYLLITFQFFISGRAQDFGANTFLYCAFAQIVIGLCAASLSNKTVPLGAVFAIAINAIEYFAYSLDHPLRMFYFVSINTIQTYQILSLIALSPGMTKLYFLRPKIKEFRWTHHRMDSGIV